MVAEDNEGSIFGLRGKFRKALRDGVHRNQIGAFDAAEIVFIDFADIDQADFFTGIEQTLDVVRGYFHREFFGHGDEFNCILEGNAGTGLIRAR